MNDLMNLLARERGAKSAVVRIARAITEVFPGTDPHLALDAAEKLHAQDIAPYHVRLGAPHGGHVYDIVRAALAR